MSRAFVKEADGWAYCRIKRESCAYADDNGKCSLKGCRVYGEEPIEEGETQRPVRKVQEKLR